MQEDTASRGISRLLKNFAIWLCHALLVLSLFLLPSSFLFTFIFSQPQQVKTVLKSADVYEDASQIIIEASAASLQSAVQSYGLPTGLVQIVSAKVFSADNVEKKSERLIDTTYKWLSGEKKTFEFDLGFEEDQQVLLGTLSEELMKFQAAKPVCSAQQLKEIAAQPSQSLFVAACRPAEFDLSSLKDIFQTQTPLETVDPAASAPTPQQSLPQIGNTVGGVSIPLLFAIVMYGFYIVLFILVFLLGILYLLLKNIKKFLSHVSKPLLTTGILLIVYGLMTEWIVSQRFLSKLATGQQSELAEKISQPFVGLSIRTTIVFGLAYVVLAIVIYLINRKFRSQEVVPTPTEEPMVLYNKDHD